VFICLGPTIASRSLDTKAFSGSVKTGPLLRQRADTLSTEFRCADELDGTSGHFYNGLRPSKANQQAYDYTAREQLRVLSLQLTGLT
jgi:hypothetical protein